MEQTPETGLNRPESLKDEELALRYGAYASYATPNDPTLVDFFGDPPAREFDRLLQARMDRGVNALDLGCGAGFTLCRVAPHFSSVWGIDLEQPLLDEARQRAERSNLTNVTLLHGNTTDAQTTSLLPDSHFSFAYSRRGPFLTEDLARKLTDDALFLVEVAQDFLGLREIFGRTPALPRSSNPDVALSIMGSAGFIAVSAKTYWFEEYFADADRLAAYLRQGAPLQNWWMDPCPYEEPRDRDALELYARYNSTPRGIKLVGSRKIYLFRRGRVDYYPVVTD